MTIHKASEKYNIPIEILREYESRGLCAAVKGVMGAREYTWLASGVGRGGARAQSRRRSRHSARCEALARRGFGQSVMAIEVPGEETRNEWLEAVVIVISTNWD